MSSEGTTVQPSLTPVNPAYLEKELTSIATSFAPSISYIDLGTPNMNNRKDMIKESCDDDNEIYGNDTENVNWRIKIQVR